MMTHSTRDTARWEQALQQLESQLEQPAVPGELMEWVDAVQGTFAETGPLVREHFRDEHARQLQDIQEHDAALTPRVENLREEGTEILGELEKLEGRMSEFSNRARQVESAEAQLADERESLVRDGTRWIIRVRRQEQAIATWYVEALERDRGVAD